MSFPACRHARRATPAATLRWLAAEPFRVFFLTGTLFSIAGVLLWPLFYAQWLNFYPGISHARVMIESFGGGFVIGFLGTAGPRVLGAPKLTPWELAALLGLHLANGVAHLSGKNAWGDALFIALLLVFAASLGARGLRTNERPPPSLLLAVLGLLCGIAGSALWLHPLSLAHAANHRFAGLLLYQGFLLGPVMGVGTFLFPRLFGGELGESSSRGAWVRTLICATALLASFVIEAWLNAASGLLLRAVAFALALGSSWWRGPAAGTLAKALRWLCLPLALAGLTAPAFSHVHRIGLEHLLFITGFGLLCFIVGSRVLFGHSGSLPGFAQRSWTARVLASLLILAALTRVSADFWPKVLVSHQIYAALIWALAAVIWLGWHARRFFKKDPDTG